MIRIHPKFWARQMGRALGRTIFFIPLVLTLRRLDPSSALPKDVAARLIQFWSNNRGTAAGVDLLVELSEQCRQSDESMLECGSGVSTLVAAVYHGDCWSLEQLPRWRRKVVRVGRAAGLPVRVLDAPLRSYGDFDWFTIPGCLPERFGLVLCDGPPGWTHGGRYGLLPVMGARIGGAVILMDDTNRAEEQHILTRWASEFGVVISGDLETFSLLQARQPQ